MSATPMSATSNPSNPRQNFTETPVPAGAASQEAEQARIEEAFVADRQMFWSRFTKFTMFGVVAVVVLLVLMWIFLA